MGDLHLWECAADTPTDEKDSAKAMYQFPVEDGKVLYSTRCSDNTRRARNGELRMLQSAALTER